VQVQAQLRQFVRNVRSVSSDRHVTERWWRDAVAMCAGRCGQLLDEYVRDGGNPMLRMQRETLTVEITATVPISAGVMQIDWREKARDVTGNLDRDTLWRGIFQTQQRTPTSVDELRDNPLGLFVTEFHWDEVSR
jgi:type IV secretory pathway TrbF-like protein